MTASRTKGSTPMRTPATVTIAFAAAAAAVLAGCSSGTTTNNTSFGRAGNAAASTTSDPTSTATQQVTDAVSHYYQVVSQLDTDVTVPVTAAEQVAGGPVLNSTKGDIIEYRSQGITITGATTVSSAKVSDLKLDAHPATSTVRVCVDTSTLDAKYPDGRSAMSASRITKSATTLTLENAAWPSATGWRVSGDSALQQRKQEPCDA